ncbi:N-myc 2 proto-oncogene protein-like [Orbicella faveolata]|uniref:N-myc 2 proto-oncogene protein-like n=1 Tax=Orbicella faveolata TaxID=48498 RepID=UPI0009E45324|nr:N-myc 2 proto-oncogene protein-like [Orbicella faveolata]
MALSVSSLLLESFSSDFDPLQPSLFKDLSDDSADVKTKTKEATDDLWKNFSFPPTPPISPACSPPYATTEEAREQPVCHGLADEGLSLDEECSLYFQAGDLKDILIKDCMWNGAAFEKNVDRKQRMHSKMERVRLLCQTPPLSESAARILSVDPSEIFPFPLSASPGSDLRESIEEQSDSEEEEVEVDVVTIENSSKRDQEEIQEIIEPESEKICATIDEPKTSQACSEILGLEDQQDADDDDEKTNFVGKIRTRRHRKVLCSDGLNYRDGRKLVKNMSSSGESDESENDSEFTRATHNVLERKRRNDLKMKFQKLRDCVPELKDNDRAPKVSILRKSWEYISQIKQEEIKLLAELEKQKKINAVLLRKLLAMNQTN